MEITSDYYDETDNRFLAESVIFHFAQMSKRGFYPYRNDQALDRVINLMILNNEMARLTVSTQFQSLIKGWEALTRSHLIRGKQTACMDGRFSEAFLTNPASESWQVLAGLIALLDRRTNQTLEPWEVDKVDRQNLVLASGDLVAKQQARGARRQEIFVEAMAHAQDPDTPNCKAWALIEQRQPSLAENSTGNYLRYLEDYTLGPILDAHNYHKPPSLPNLGRAGLAAVLYTSNYDVVIHNNGDQLSTRQLAEEFGPNLTNFFGQNNARHRFTESFAGDRPITLDNYLKLMTKHYSLVNEVINNPDSSLSSFHSYIEGFLKRFEPSFTDLQQYAGKVNITSKMLLHHLIDFGAIPDHYFSKHREVVMSISERGNPPLRRHPIQSLALNPANSEKAAKYGVIGLNVLDGSYNEGEPHIVFVGSDIPEARVNANGKNKDYQRATAINWNLFRAIVSDPEFQSRVREGRLLVFPMAVGQYTQTIYGLFDHSYQAPILTAG